MDKYLGKTYKLKSSENFDEYLKAIDVGLISRKLATSLSPTSELVKNDDGSFSLKFVTPIRTITITFKLGEEFVEERADGVKVKSLIYLEGENLVQSQVEECGRKSIHVREFTDTSLVVTSTVDGWDGKCVRIYELVK